MHVSGTLKSNQDSCRQTGRRAILLLVAAVLLIALQAGLVAQETRQNEPANASPPEIVSPLPKEPTPPALLRPAIQISAQPLKPAVLNRAKPPAILLKDSVDHDAARLERHLNTMFPKSQIDLVVLQNGIAIQGKAASAADSNVIHQIVRERFARKPAAARPGYARVAQASGTKSEPGEAEEGVFNLLEVAGDRQVTIEMRFMKVEKSHLKLLSYIVNSRGRGHPVGDDSRISGVFAADDTRKLVLALLESGAAEIVMAPKMTVFSGHTASFLSGGEFPVPAIAGAGITDDATISFRPFGTSILLRPVVTSNDVIDLEVTPEVSRINHDRGVDGIPGLDSRKSSTKVRLRSGQTVVLESDALGQFERKLGEKPSMLGRLTRLGRQPERGEADSSASRMVLFITARIVDEEAPSRLPLLPGVPLPAAVVGRPATFPAPATVTPVAEWTPNGQPLVDMSRVQKMENAIRFLKSAGLDQLATSVELELKATHQETARAELAERQIELQRLQVEIARLSRAAGVEPESLSHFRLNTIVARTTITALASAGFKPPRPSFRIVKPTVEVRSLFQKLASDGEIKILSNPVMLVADGRTVRWMDGREIPTPTQLIDNGKQVVTTGFRDVGLSLTLTPHRKDDGTFQLDVVHRAAELQHREVIQTRGTDKKDVDADVDHASVELTAGETLLSGKVFADGSVELIRIRPELVSSRE